MCNLSEAIEERGIEQGIEQGIERGIEQGIERGIEQGELRNSIKIFKKCLKRGDSKQEAMDFAEIGQALADELYDEFLKEKRKGSMERQKYRRQSV